MKNARIHIYFLMMTLSFGNMLYAKNQLLLKPKPANDSQSFVQPLAQALPQPYSVVDSYFRAQSYSEAKNYFKARTFSNLNSYFDPSLSQLIKVDSCEYYNTLKAQMNCPESHYIDTFANPYCNYFLNQKYVFSPKGQKILSNIRLCLQEQLAANNDLTCDNLETFGIESHYNCYIWGGFCVMPPIDMAMVIWMGKQSASNLEVLKMFYRVLDSCYLSF